MGRGFEPHPPHHGNTAGQPAFASRRYVWPSNWWGRGVELTHFAGAGVHQLSRALQPHGPGATASPDDDVLECWRALVSRAFVSRCRGGEDQRQACHRPGHQGLGRRGRTRLRRRSAPQAWAEARWGRPRASGSGANRRDPPGGPGRTRRTRSRQSLGSDSSCHPCLRRVKVHDSARKHGVEPDDAVHAAEHAFCSSVTWTRTTRHVRYASASTPTAGVSRSSCSASTAATGC